MKKFVLFLMLFALLLSCCACGGPADQSTTAGTGATEESQEMEATGSADLTFDMSPEKMYGHINQLEPTDGVYKIWSEVGVQNMAAHPEGTFELLCNVDMQGAALQPIGSVSQPFTGTIRGANFIISNFTISQSAEGALGFVGVNKGTVQDLQLEGMTVTADADAKYIGTLAGINEGSITRSKATGTLTVEQAAEGAACGSAIGSNTGSFTNVVMTVETKYTAAGSAVIGGLAGQSKGGKIDYVETHGGLEITGENKTVGLLVGELTDATVSNCAFVGATNTLNGELFIQLAANQTENAFVDCAYRDNTPVIIPENELKLRETAIQRMYEITTIQWRVHETLENNEGTFNPKYTYYGMPYRHMGASLARIQYLLDEEGYVKEFAYDIPRNELQSYMGNDCSTALIHALWTVSNSVDFGHCQRQHPLSDGGCLPVGDWAWEEDLGFLDTEPYVLATGEQEMYEAYAQLKKGDFYFYMIPELGGHTRMAAENAVVVRNLDGTINPNYSYVVSHEQGYTTQDEVNMTYTTCRAGHKYTFANLYYDTALPVTCEEFITGQMEPATAEIVDSQEGKMGLITGTVKTNYYLDYVDLIITDSQGTEVFNHRMFPGVGKTGDSSDNTRRFYIDSFDMGRFATPLAETAFEQGQTYSYKIIATNSPGDSIVVKEASFVQGAAE